MKRTWKSPLTVRTAALAVALAAVCLAAAPTLGAGPPAPAGRTYFAVFLGLEDELEPSAGCLRFKRSELCVDETTCGTWRLGGRPARRQAGLEIEFDYVDEESGTRIVIDGRARMDKRGPGNTVAGVALIRVGELRVNVGFVAQPAPPALCPELAAAFNAVNGVD